MPEVFFVLVAVIVVIGGIAVAVDSMSSRPAPPPPSPEDYDQEAALHRARARALDAQAAYDDSRAKAALKRHELAEVEQFIKQDGQRAGNGRR